MPTDVHRLLQGHAHELQDPELHDDYRESPASYVPAANGHDFPAQGEAVKQMILTGLATEQSFRRNGEAQFFLIFNDGELRVPCTEQAAQIVAETMYGTANSNGHAEVVTPQEEPEARWYPSQDFGTDENGVEQA